MAAKIKIGNYGYTCQPRWGFGRPTHPRLTEIIGRGKAAYQRQIEHLISLGDLFAAIPMEAPEDSSSPRWIGTASSAITPAPRMPLPPNLI